jgi:hypothetical protein
MNASPLPLLPILHPFSPASAPKNGKHESISPPPMIPRDANCHAHDDNGSALSAVGKVPGKVRKPMIPVLKL